MLLLGMKEEGELPWKPLNQAKLQALRKVRQITSRPSDDMLKSSLILISVRTSLYLGFFMISIGFQRDKQLSGLRKKDEKEDDKSKQNKDHKIDVLCYLKSIAFVILVKFSTRMVHTVAGIEAAFLSPNLITPRFIAIPASGQIKRFINIVDPDRNRIESFHPFSPPKSALARSRNSGYSNWPLLS